MNIIITNTYSQFETEQTENLFLNPDGTRTRFPIGWNGNGRYVPGTLRLYRASDNTPIDPATYSEEDNGVFFNFASAPAAGSYTDIVVKYFVRPEDYAFSEGTADSAYPDEEYFLFPNWNNALGCGDAFWIGKYAASRSDATTSSQGSSNTPVSKKGKCSWVNTTFANQVAACAPKGKGFHCIRNREWVSIALWTEKMGINVYGNFNGYNSNGQNIDMRGIGTNITSAMSDNSDTNHKILTGMGPDSFRHNGKSGGISDLAGNVWECVDGLQLKNGVPYIFAEDNSTYVALSASVMRTDSDVNITYINNSTNDMLNEGLPVASGGFPITVSIDHLWQNRSGDRICYRGADCYFDASVGIWALYLKYDASGSGWNTGFRLACSL